MGLALVSFDTHQFTDCYISPENEPPDDDHRERVNLPWQSPLEIRDFLRLRMADCLPQIGEIGRLRRQDAGEVVPI